LSPIRKADSTRSMRKSVRWSTAFHEAGHAVSSWRHKFKVHCATIVPAADLHGEVELENPLHGIRLKFDDSARAHRRVQLAIIVCLSGPEAQRQYNPRSWRSHHGASDLKRAKYLARAINKSDDAKNAYLRWLKVVARDEVAASWPLIERVAGALIARDTLTAAEIAEILYDAAFRNH
jgi:ATP-dependent Zn protease